MCPVNSEVFTHPLLELNNLALDRHLGKYKILWYLYCLSSKISLINLDRIAKLLYI